MLWHPITKKKKISLHAASNFDSLEVTKVLIDSLGNEDAESLNIGNDEK
jgi:hypothetical protein